MEPLIASFSEVQGFSLADYEAQLLALCCKSDRQAMLLEDIRSFQNRAAIRARDEVHEQPDDLLQSAAEYGAAIKARDFNAEVAEVDPKIPACDFGIVVASPRCKGEEVILI